MRKISITFLSIFLFLTFALNNVSADELSVLEALENATNYITDRYTSAAKRQKLSEAVSKVKTQIKLYRYSEGFNEAFAQAAESCYENMDKYQKCMSALAATDFRAYKELDCEKTMEPCKERAPELLEKCYKTYSNKK